MKIDENAEKALQQPDTEAVMVEMTPERVERFARISHQVVDLLKRETSGPVEGYMLLQFIRESFEECYGIRGGMILDKRDERH